MKKKYSVVSLFSGCGGTDLGLEGNFTFLDKKFTENNFEIIWANDIDANACQTYKNNFSSSIICADIKDILNNSYSRNLFDKPLPGEADVVIGGFPCQDFSLAGKRRGFNSERGNLYQSMVEVVSRINPKIFLAENVKGLLSIHDGKAVNIIANDFASLGYKIQFKLFQVADYGVPQNRERIIIVGTRNDLNLNNYKFPNEVFHQSKWITLGDCISDLENIQEGDMNNHYWSKAKMFPGTQGNSLTSKTKAGPTMRAEHHGNIEFHWNGKRRLSAREAARIQSFPDNFKFYPSTSSAYRQIGNAVPPVFAWHIAQSVQEFLNDEKALFNIHKSKSDKKNSRKTPVLVSAGRSR